MYSFYWLFTVWHLSFELGVVHCKSQVASKTWVQFVGNWPPLYWSFGLCAISVYGRVSSGQERWILNIGLDRFLFIVKLFSNKHLCVWQIFRWFTLPLCSHTSCWQYCWFVESLYPVPSKELNSISYRISPS